MESKTSEYVNYDEVTAEMLDDNPTMKIDYGDSWGVTSPRRLAHRLSEIIKSKLGRHKKIRFDIGDIFNEAVYYNVDTELLEIMKHAQVNYETIRKWAWVAARTPHDLRTLPVSMTHLEIVSGIEDLGIRVSLLKIAIDEDMGTREFRNYVKGIMQVVDESEEEPEDPVDEAEQESSDPESPFDAMTPILIPAETYDKYLRAAKLYDLNFSEFLIAISNRVDLEEILD